MVRSVPEPEKYADTLMEFCFGCRRHLQRTKFPLSAGSIIGR